jgi:hypothetical protein
MTPNDDIIDAVRQAGKPVSIAYLAAELERDHTVLAHAVKGMLKKGQLACELGQEWNKTVSDDWRLIPVSVTPSLKAPSVLNTLAAKPLDFSKVQIQAGVPLPARLCTGSSKYTALFGRLQPGTSFAVPYNEKRAIEALVRAFRKHATSHKWEVAVRKILEDGVTVERFWRLS